MTVLHFWKGIHLQVYQLHQCHRRSLQSEGNEALHLKSSQATKEKSYERHRVEFNSQDRLAFELLCNYDSIYAGLEISEILQEYLFCFSITDFFSGQMQNRTAEILQLQMASKIKTVWRGGFLKAINKGNLNRNQKS